MVREHLIYLPSHISDLFSFFIPPSRICFRLVLMSCVINKYWNNTYACDEEHGLMIRIYLASIIAIICVNLILAIIIVNRSAQGGITEINLRWLVAPLLTVKIVLILPETILNIFATLWAFCDTIKCQNADFFSKIMIESEFLITELICEINRGGLIFSKSISFCQ